MAEKPDPAADQLRLAVEILERRFAPAAILLYGSQSSGRAGRDSDVDLAILVDGPAPDASELAEVRGDLEAALGSEVDLVVLNRVSPILAMQILRAHTKLAAADPAALDAFVVRTLTDYFDLKLVRKPIEDALLRPSSP